MRCPKCRKDFDTRCCPNCGYSPEAEAGVQPSYIPPIDGAQASYQQQYTGYQPPPIIINNNIPVNEKPINNRAISPKKKWVALFLCLFFGMLGVHRFYVGKIGTGLFILVNVGFIIYVPICFYFIDIAMILIGSFTDKQGNFLV